ncbi:MAG: hypothetical protein P9L99_19325 [Candidatus Lernaella stagnicola]|nr:hypothetical protein [Candidatus Lernaella stagnicola]
MSFLDEEKRAAQAAPILLDLLESPGRFNELFAAFHEADGLIDGDFLDQVPQARSVWEKAGEIEAIDEILALPLAFREAVFFGLQRDGHTEILSECLHRSGEKLIKKRLKRILFEMKQAGHAVPVKRKAKPLFQKGVTETEPGAPCFISNVDGRNERILIINEATRRGVRTLQVYERDGNTVVHHYYDETSRKKMRSFINEMRDVREVPLVELDLVLAHFFLGKLRRRMDGVDSPVPSGFTTAVARLTPPPDVPTAHPYRSLIDAERVLARLGELQASEALHGEPEFRYWMCDRDTLQSFQLALQDMDTTGLAISDQQKREQIETRVARAVEGFFTQERRDSYADRLRDEAFFLARREAVVEAETAAALALYLDDEKRPVGTVPFFAAMLKKVFASLLGGPKPEPESPSGLIL